MAIDKFDKFNEAKSGVDDLVKRTEKTLIKDIVKDVKKLRNFGANVQDEGFKDAQNQVLETLKKYLKTAK